MSRGEPKIVTLVAPRCDFPRTSHSIFVLEIDGGSTRIYHRLASSLPALNGSRLPSHPPHTAFPFSTSCIVSRSLNMGFELTDTMGDTVPSPRMTRQSEEVILNIMTDIQKAVDQLGDMSSSEDARKFTFSCVRKHLTMRLPRSWRGR